MRHGEARHGRVTKEYKAWQGMRSRCLKPRDPRWEDYGGRGITIDPRWDNFEVFLADMGRCPSAKHSLDRKDNDGPYNKRNCRWATPLEQSSNKRSNTRLTFRGKTQHIGAWARETGLKVTTIIMRIQSYGWSVDEALSTPVRKTCR